MPINLCAKAGVILVTTSLGLGLGCNYDSPPPKPIELPQSLKEINEKKPITNNIRHDKDSLTYTNDAQPYAHYQWTITDANNGLLSFYGQGTNKVTITAMTDISKSTGNIKVSCIVTRGKKTAKGTDKEFTVDKHAIEKLVIQTEATRARLAWQEKIKLLETDKDLTKCFTEEMKLNESDAKNCLGKVKKFRTDQKDTNAQTTRLNEIDYLQKPLMYAPFYDATYEKIYPNESLGYPVLKMLKDLLIEETEKVAKDLAAWQRWYKTSSSTGIEYIQNHAYYSKQLLTILSFSFSKTADLCITAIRSDATTTDFARKLTTHIEEYLNNLNST